MELAKKLGIKALKHFILSFTSLVGLDTLGGVIDPGFASSLNLDVVKMAVIGGATAAFNVVWLAVYSWASKSDG